MTKRERKVFNRIMQLKKKDVFGKHVKRDIEKAISFSQFFFTTDKKLFDKFCDTVRKLDAVMNDAKLPNCIQILATFGLTREAVQNMQQRRKK